MLFGDDGPKKGLDIGTGANFIYPVLANAKFGWEMVGSDINKEAIENAQ